MFERDYYLSPMSTFEKNPIVLTIEIHITFEEVIEKFLNDVKNKIKEREVC